MTTEFRFTDAVNAASVSGVGPFGAGTPFNTGTARTRPTTRQAIFDEIALALVAAGWTEVQHVANTRHVYKSNGEDTTEVINIEIQLTGTGRYLHFHIGTKVDASDELQGRVGNTIVSPTSGFDQFGYWDLTAADFTSDFFILATKDRLFCMFQNINHTSTKYWASLGLGKRSNILNPNKYALAANATAGAYVTLSTAPGNPIADGYRPGDVIDIVETDPLAGFAARRLLAVDVTASSFQVLRLPVNFNAGSLLGQQPSPLFRGVGNNTEVTSAFVWASAYSPVPYSGFDDLRALQEDGDLDPTNEDSFGRGSVLDTLHLSDGRPYLTSGEYGAGGTPNQRTQRFTCRNLAMGKANQEIQLIHPNLIAYPATANLYPHDWMKADRVTPNRYFVSLRPTATSTERWGVGPTS